MPVLIPRAARLAAPRFARGAAFPFASGAAVALAAGVFVTPLLGAVAALGAVAVVVRRRTVGAYEGVDGLVVRNWFRTRELPWALLRVVESRRDAWAPWYRVPVIRLESGSPVPVSALRHLGRSAPAGALTLTRGVRDRREARSRQIYRD